MALRNKNLPPLSSSFSSSIKELEEEALMKQGILTILSSDCASTKSPNSLRRTLSADMSSKKWLAQNGFFSPMKNMDSSEENEQEKEDEKSPEQDDVWMSIQSQKETQKPAQMQVWGSILTQKSENSCDVKPPPVYVHPLVKRSSSTMSEKSLEICTESIGSETGSDGFSSYPPSEVDEEEMKGVVDFHVSAKCKKSSVRPLPPPLSSISRGDGAAVHVHSRRGNGRLVLEAVSIPSRNCFHASRRDGRLVLTLINSDPTPQETEDLEENRVNGFEEVFDDMEEINQDFTEGVDTGGGGDGGGYREEEEAVAGDKFESENIEFVGEQNSRSLPSGIIGVAKSGLIMKKIMTFGKKNPAWSDKFNRVVDSMEAEEEVAELSIPQSLPPPPRVTLPPPAASDSINGGGFITGNGNKSEHFVPYLKGCKEPRRSLLFWEETQCIAT